MRAESIKGVLMLGAAVNVRRLRTRGRVTQEELDARLPAEALELIDQKIDPARWYPVRAFCDLTDVDWEMSGQNDPSYLEEQGRIAAERLFDTGIYQQLEFAERSGKMETREGLLRSAKLITTLTGTLYDFLTFDARLAEGHLEVEFGNAAAFGDCLIHSTVGFLNGINDRQDSRKRWTASREAPDRVRFRVALPKHLA